MIKFYDEFIGYYNKNKTKNLSMTKKDCQDYELKTACKLILASELS